MTWSQKENEYIIDKIIEVKNYIKNKNKNVINKDIDILLTSKYSFLVSSNDITEYMRYKKCINIPNEMDIT